MHNTSKVIELEIVELNAKGNGIGFFESSAGFNRIEVPFVIPQDIVRVDIKPKKKGLGILKEIVKFSPLRQEPRCKHFTDCGGCCFQNLPYTEQLKIKEQVVVSSFKSLLKGTEKIRPIIACESQWHYRNKMEFSFSEDLKRNKYLGLIKSQSKGRVVSLEECHLTSPWFIKALHSVREWWEDTQITAHSGISGIGSLRTLTLREGVRSGDRMAILTASGDPEYALNKYDLEKFVQSLNKTFDLQPSLKSIFLRFQQAVKGTETNFFEINLHGASHIREILNIKLDENEPPHRFIFRISPTAFFQPNTAQAERLFEEAIRMAEITSDTVVYDLYCGIGTIGIIAAKKAKQVIGVEIFSEAILDAKKNAEINEIKNITFLTGAVRNVLPEIKYKNILPPPDIAVVSPPRSGLDQEAMQGLIETAPPKILYFSSNPLTQSENVRRLMEHGYKIVSIQPIDQFPHTPHVQNLVLLSL